VLEALSTIEILEAEKVQRLARAVTLLTALINWETAGFRPDSREYTNAYQVNPLNPFGGTRWTNPFNQCPKHWWWRRYDRKHCGDITSSTCNQIHSTMHFSSSMLRVNIPRFRKKCFR
jgi:hypothetical protein